MITKVDVTIAELKMAVAYAQIHGQGLDKFVTLHIDKTPIIDTIGVSKTWNSDVTWLGEDDNVR